MNLELLGFQEETVATAVDHLRNAIREVSLPHVGVAGSGQAVTLVAPTGAGKTVMAAAILEALFWGDASSEAGIEGTTVVWLSDLPNVNEQAKAKIGRASGRLEERLRTIGTSFRERTLEPGHVYFLNTQKLMATGSLVGAGDVNLYSIWDVLDRTIRRDPGRFLLIIDEAHRGMDRTNSEADTANSIVQRFIYGSAEMVRTPIILGLSATPQRFNDLVSGTGRALRPATADVDQVRASGLIKKRIKVWRPGHGDAHSGMTLLQRAAQDLHGYQTRWSRYCGREGLAPVHPILVVQVEDKTGDRITATDIEHAIEAIESVTGVLHPDAYAHSFGDAPAAVSLGSRRIRYLKPHEIDADDQVVVVFFKTGLSTGWDCPRAEVMMSFRTAHDHTLIAQLVGRMVRTPLARHVVGDEALNSVALYLPKYDRTGVQRILRQLRSGDPDYLPPTDAVDGAEVVVCERREDLWARISDAATALPTFVVPRARKMPPVRRLEKLAGLLSDQEIHEEAPAEMTGQLVDLLWERLNDRRGDAEFERVVARSREIGLVSTELTYLTGVTQEETIRVESTSRSLDRLFEQVGTQVGAGLHDELWRRIRREDTSVPGDTARLYVVATLGQPATRRDIDDFCREQFDDWRSTYARQIDELPEEGRMAFRRLEEHAEAPTQHAFTPTVAIEPQRNDGTTDYDRHLYQDEHRQYPDTFNGPEKQVVEEALAAPELVTWIRNRPRQAWALAIPYVDPSGDPVAMYPDFLFFRQEGERVVVDLIDPHGVHIPDAPARARGLAEYAKRFGHLYARIDMMIYDRDSGRQKHLPLKQPSVRDSVRRVSTREHLEALFDVLGT